MEDVKALGEKFVRVRVSVIVYLAHPVDGGDVALRARALFSGPMTCAYCIPHTLMRVAQL